MIPNQLDLAPADILAQARGRDGGRYSLYADPAVDVRIQKDLDRLNQAFRLAFPDLVATLLVGSFGRGEGQVLVSDEAEERTIRPLNDYDVVVVTEGGTPRIPVNDLRAELAQELGIDWVDIVVYPRTKLPRLRPTLFNYDLKYGSLVIDGDEKIQNLMPDWDAVDIPLDEAERLLFTRLWCLLGPYHLGAEDEGVTDEQATFVARQFAKALIGIQDAQLLLIGAYETSYLARAERFRLEFPEQEELFPLFDAANQEKLLPGPQPAEGLDLASGYAKVRRLMLDAFRLIGFSLYRKPVASADVYAKAYRGSLRRRMDRARGQIKRNPYHRRTQLVNAAQLFLVEAQPLALELKRGGMATITQGGDVAHRLLGAFDPVAANFLPQDWDGLRARAVEMRMAV